MERTQRGSCTGPTQIDSICSHDKQVQFRNQLCCPLDHNRVAGINAKQFACINCQRLSFFVDKPNSGLRRTSRLQLAERTVFDRVRVRVTMVIGKNLGEKIVALPRVNASSSLLGIRPTIFTRTLAASCVVASAIVVGPDNKITDGHGERDDRQRDAIAVQIHERNDRCLPSVQ